MNRRERFCAACRGEAVDRPPVWVMRQAGRYLPEYLELRSRHSFLDVCHKAELAREVALQPLRRFPLDAAILFSDILVVPEAMGITVDYPDGGPTLAPLIDSQAALQHLHEPDITRELGYVGEALDAIRDGIGPDMALIGFAGAPYTLATYMVEGGGGEKRFRGIKRLAAQEPEFLQSLLDRLVDTVTGYLRMQIEHGADALQLFDTWAGELSPADFRRFALPAVARIVENLKPSGVPVIYYVNGVGGLLEDMTTSGADVLSVDWRVSLADARRRTNDAVPLQGNLDPLELTGSEAYIRRRVRELHAEMRGGRGHIFNLGHGVLPDTPIEGVRVFVDEVTRLGE